MYHTLLRPILFALNPELSHNFSLKAMRRLNQLGLLKCFLKAIPPVPKRVFGLDFPNPVGLAAGFDKNGDYIDALAALGFGFIEIGTVTPKPQSGNPKPRIFRLTPQQAIINRMGFNNKGVDYLVHQVKRKKYTGILGINIGKNASTPMEQAIEDYHFCLQRVYPHASYITLNISSPNTQGLRNLQGADALLHLLTELQKKQIQLANEHNRYVPMLIKVAPDLTPQEVTQMGQIFCAQKVDGIIATNTTLDRQPVQGSRFAEQAGGLSGAPLFLKSTEVLSEFKTALSNSGIPIIASGGIMSPSQASAKMEAGAELVQLYTGLIYSGPRLIKEASQAIARQSL